MNASDKDVIILTPDGVRDLKNNDINLIAVYLYSNLKTIRHRLEFRGDDEKEVERRISSDIKDFKDAEMLADRIVYNNLNDNIDNVVENIVYWYKKILKEKRNEK